MKNNKGIVPILIILIIVGVLAVTGGTYYFLVKKTPKPVGCTMEAKICPDGSAVGRTGPKCEFAECPTVKDETVDWKTYANEEYGYKIKYPKEYYVYDYSYDGSQHPEEVEIQSFPRPKEGGYSGIGGTGCQTSIYVSKEYSSFQDWVDKEKTNLGTDLERSSIEDIMVGNVKGYKVSFFGTFMGSGKSTVILFDAGNLYTIYNYQQGVTEGNCDFIFNQMLSTFKFIEQNEIKTGKIEINNEEISKIQESVDQGQQPWRLDPESVVRAEIDQYGFVQSDLSSLKLIFHAASAAVNEYEITHNGKVYIITVIQEVPGDGQVWVISSIKLK